MGLTFLLVMITLESKLDERPNPNLELEATSIQVVNERIFTRRDYFWFIVLSCTSIIAISLFLWHWFSRPRVFEHPIIFPALTLVLLVKLSINQLRWYILPTMKRPLPIKSRPGWRVAAVTTLVPAVESLEMLEVTVKALVGMEYPHETWVLDEGDDAQVKLLCNRLGSQHFSRKSLPQYQAPTGSFQSISKHGNYNAWLTEIGFARYDIVTSFDPDHAPAPFFLQEVLGYFNDPQVGYVQLPQAYYNKKASFIAHGAAEESYGYYACSQTAAYAMGHPMVIGSHNTHRVEALKDVGGFAPHAADDLLITLFYRAKRWRGVYVPRIMAEGLAPVNWRDYLTQQLRWAKSVLDIKMRFYPKFAGKLQPRERFLRFLHGLNFVESGITTFILLSLLCIILITGNPPSVLSFSVLMNLFLLCCVLQLCEFFRQRFYLDRKTERGVLWRATLMRYAKWPYLFWAFFKVIFREQAPYSLTPKVKTSAHNFMLLRPHALAVGVICAAWLIGTFTERLTQPWVHVLAGGVVIGTIALMCTEFIKFPTPFDRRWLPRHQRLEIVRSDASADFQSK